MTDNPKSKAADVRADLVALQAKHGWTRSDMRKLLQPKKASGSTKGFAFEREFCPQLGKWWCGAEDIFWRTAGSGGRATNRTKRGKTTAGAYGDIAATDPRGADLMQLLTFELKRGFEKSTIMGGFDRLNQGQSEFEAWVMQAETAAWESGSLAWAIVCQRDRRTPLVWLPMHFVQRVRQVGAWPGGRPIPSMQVLIALHCGPASGYREEELFCVTLSKFFELNPDNLRKLL